MMTALHSYSINIDGPAELSSMQQLRGRNESSNLPIKGRQHMLSWIKPKQRWP
jgi:hypothetical protein